jgi:threonine synthase
MAMLTEVAYQECINPKCRAQFDCAQSFFKCPQCGELLDIKYNWDKVAVPKKLSDFAARWANRNNPLDYSGVWRFRDLLNFCDDRYKVTVGEGQTVLQ